MSYMTQENKDTHPKEKSWGICFFGKKENHYITHARLEFKNQEILSKLITSSFCKKYNYRNRQNQSFK